jgi:AcrR family transcriptional regulator
MPKIIDYETRRREIAALAISVLVRDGIQKASMASIALSCGMRRTTLYQYFSHVGELVDFTLSEIFGTLDAKAVALLTDSSLGPVERLLLFMHDLAREAITDRNRMVLVLDFLLHPHRKVPGVEFDVQEHVRTLRGELENMLSRAIEGGELHAIDAKSMAFTLFAFIEAATVHAALYENISLENTIRDVDRLILGLRHPVSGKPKGQATPHRKLRRRSR